MAIYPLKIQWAVPASTGLKRPIVIFAGNYDTARRHKRAGSAPAGLLIDTNKHLNKYPKKGGNNRGRRSGPNGWKSN
jgi:hypothetical protein